MATVVYGPSWGRAICAITDSDRSAEVLDRVERVALRLDQLCVRVRSDVRLAAETPAREHDLAEGARRDRGLGAEHRLGVAVVEVDRQEQVPLGRLAQELVRLGKIEHERLLDEERNSAADQLERRGEVVLVRQRDGDEVRLGGVQHRSDVGVAPGACLCCLPSHALVVPADDRDDGRVGPLGEHPDVLPPPAAGTDDRDAQGRAASGVGECRPRSVVGDTVDDTRALGHDLLPVVGQRVPAVKRHAACESIVCR